MSFYFGGMASGLDTHHMIEQLMHLEQEPVRRMERNQEEINEQISALQSVNSTLDNFKRKITDLEDVFDKIGVTSSDEEVLTAAATSSADQGVYELEVTQLAEVERVASLQQEEGIELGEDETAKLVIDEIEITIEDGDDLRTIRDKFNAEDIDVTASIVDNRLIFTGDELGTENRISFADTNEAVLEYLFDIEDLLDEDGYIEAGAETSEGFQPLLQKAEDSIFTVNGLEVVRSAREIDDVIEGVTLDLKTTGTSTLTVELAEEEIKDKINDFVNTYNSLRDELAKKGGREGVLQGDATLRRIESNLYNNLFYPVTTISSTERMSSSLDLNGELNIDFGSDTLTVNFDNDQGVVRGDLLDLIKDRAVENGLTVEADDEQLTVKKDDSILGSIEIQSGSLVIDSNSSRPVDLSTSDDRILEELKLNPSFKRNFISAIGISADRHGELSVDNSRLDESLEENLDDIKQLFTGVGGVIERVESGVEMATDRFDGYIGTRINSLEGRVRSIDDNIESLDRRLSMREESLIRQFGRMEQAISNMQGQGAWMSAQIASLGLHW